MRLISETKLRDKIKGVCWVLSLSLVAPLYAFSQKAQLSVGDKIPDVQLEMLNYNTNTTNLASFKGKLVILDFWASWCGSCIGGMPKLDALQQEFSKDIQILGINYETREKIEEFKKQNDVVGDVKLPFVANDVVLHKLFPSKSIPHVIWIDKAGFVKAITGSDMVTAERIKAAMNNDYASFSAKKELFSFDVQKSLLEVAHQNIPENILTNTTFTQRLPDYRSRQGSMKDSTSLRFFFINIPILDMYRTALGFESNRVILEMQDPSRFFKSIANSKTWEDDNLFCYDLRVPKETDGSRVSSLMLEDLNANLKYEGRMEIRKIKCWVLQRTSTDSLFKTRGGASYTNSEDKGTKRRYNNVELNRFLFECNLSILSREVKPVFLDETNFKGKVDLVISSAAIENSNIQLLNENLSKYGLKLLPAERELKMFVLKEKNNSPTSNYVHGY